MYFRRRIGTRSSVLINLVSLFQGVSFKRDVYTLCVQICMVRMGPIGQGFMTVVVVHMLLSGLISFKPTVGNERETEGACFSL